MTRRTWMVAVAALGASLALGCSGDMTQMLTSNQQMQTQVMGAISGNAELAGKMVDQLMADETTRTMMMEKLTSSSEAMQAMMARMAQDQTMVDGVINMAVQDSSMRAHVMTLFKGMQMGGGGMSMRR